MISFEEKAREIGLDEALIVELFLDFLAQSREDLAALKEGLKAEDSISVVRSAHSIKGAAANLRAGEITALSQKIEEFGKSDNLSELKDLVGRLEALFDDLSVQLASTPNPKAS